MLMWFSWAPSLSPLLSLNCGKLSRNFLAIEPENHPPSMVLGGAAPPDYKIAGIHISVPAVHNSKGSDFI